MARIKQRKLELRVTRLCWMPNLNDSSQLILQPLLQESRIHLNCILFIINLKHSWNALIFILRSSAFMVYSTVEVEGTHRMYLTRKHFEWLNKRRSWDLKFIKDLESRQDIPFQFVYDLKAISYGHINRQLAHWIMTHFGLSNKVGNGT